MRCSVAASHIYWPHVHQIHQTHRHTHRNRRLLPNTMLRSITSLAAVAVALLALHCKRSEACSRVLFMSDNGTVLVSPSSAAARRPPTHFREPIIHSINQSTNQLTEPPRCPARWTGWRTSTRTSGPSPRAWRRTGAPPRAATPSRGSPSMAALSLRDTTCRCVSFGLIVFSCTYNPLI